MISKTTIFYIGCSLVPTPPSPCFDFGLQFLVVIIIGIISPKFLIKPVNRFIILLGRFCRWFFGKIPLIKILVEKTDKALKKWKTIMTKDHRIKNKYLKWFLKIIVKEDFFQRMLFGYFVTVVLGTVLMLLAFFVL